MVTSAPSGATAAAASASVRLTEALRRLPTRARTWMLMFLLEVVHFGTCTDCNDPMTRHHSRGAGRTLWVSSLAGIRLAGAALLQPGLHVGEPDPPVRAAVLDRDGAVVRQPAHVGQ